jgi:hypothetical protein
MNTISNSQRLREKIELVLPEFVEASTDLVTHPRFAELYPEMLVSMHWMIRSTVPLMQATLDRSRQLAKSDAVAAALVPYLAQHIKEEMHHDQWLLEDLELLGFPRHEVLQRIPSPAVAACVGARYYWVIHHHPIAELGGIAVMEGYPPSLEVIDMMEEITGLPRAAFRTIEKHSHLDPHHRDELLETIDRLPLEEEHHKMLGVAALYTVESASAVYREILERLPEPVAN